MAKKIKVVIAQGVKFEGKYPPIGSEIEIEGTEAKRLLGLGAVTLPKAKLEEALSSPAVSGKPNGGKGSGKPAAGAELEAVLIEKIKAAQSQEELEELVAGNEKLPEVVEAASARLEELLGSGAK